MIAAYLRTLNDEQLGRIIVTTMRPGSYIPLSRHGPCLVGVACGLRNADDYATSAELSAHFETKLGSLQQVEHRYDALCLRFGVKRVNLAIRERCLRLWMSRQPLPLQMAERRYPMSTVFAGMAVETARTVWGNK